MTFIVKYNGLSLALLCYYQLSWRLFKGLNMTTYETNKHEKVLSLLFAASVDNEKKQNLIYAYRLSNGIKTDERLFDKTHDKRFLERAKVKKGLLFDLPDYVYSLYHNITGYHLVRKPICVKNAFLSCYDL